jgi:hypothetical protein
MQLCIHLLFALILRQTQYVSQEWSIMITSRLFDHANLKHGRRRRLSCSVLPTKGCVSSLVSCRPAKRLRGVQQYSVWVPSTWQIAVMRSTSCTGTGGSSRQGQLPWFSYVRHNATPRIQGLKRCQTAWHPGLQYQRPRFARSSDGRAKNSKTLRPTPASPEEAG